LALVKYETAPAGCGGVEPRSIRVAKREEIFLTRTRYTVVSVREFLLPLAGESSPAKRGR
jgi:hypothetical protein